MKNFLVIIACLILFTDAAFAQSKLFTKNGVISFKSKTVIQNIEAVNNKTLSVWDLSTGKIEFSVLIKGFQFEKALMQEHFNENYMESSKYPKAVFTGIVQNMQPLEGNVNKEFVTKVVGTLTMHGITKPVTALTKITAKNGTISGVADFFILASDYDIKIPALVSNKVNNRIDIRINVAAFQPLISK